MGSIEIVNAAQKRVPQPDLLESPVWTSCQTKPKNLLRDDMRLAVLVHVKLSLKICSKQFMLEV